MLLCRGKSSFFFLLFFSPLFGRIRVWLKKLIIWNLKFTRLHIFNLMFTGEGRRLLVKITFSCCFGHFSALPLKPWSRHGILVSVWLCFTLSPRTVCEHVYSWCLGLENRMVNLKCITISLVLLLCYPYLPFLLPSPPPPPSPLPTHPPGLALFSVTVSFIYSLLVKKQDP